MDGFIDKYFKDGMTNIEIREILRCTHGYIVSERTLKRVLQRLGLTRRYVDLLEAACFVENEISSSGNGNGYRWMHAKCVQQGISISREKTEILLQILDPEGVSLRTRRRLRRRQYYAPGPNCVWHIDGYDKLKPYGIAIHGCVDGFARKIIWLEARFTNNDPTVIAGFFTASVAALGGVPVTVRGDFGNENGHVRHIQMFLRRNGADDIW